MTDTNATTNLILDFFFRSGIFAFRTNVAPIPVQRKGALVGFRSGGKSGTPDIQGILPPHGTYFGIEVKTGKDTLRPAQLGFHKTARKAGGIILVVKSFEDFLEQWKEIDIKYLTGHN